MRSARGKTTTIWCALLAIGVLLPCSIQLSEKIRREADIEVIRELRGTLGLWLPWGLVPREELERLAPSGRLGTWVFFNRRGEFAWSMLLRCGERNPRWGFIHGVTRELLPKALLDHLTSRPETQKTSGANGLAS